MAADAQRLANVVPIRPPAAARTDPEPPHPGPPPPTPGIDAPDAAWREWDQAHRTWARACARHDAWQRRQQRVTLPHPNWLARLPTCVVRVLCKVPPGDQGIDPPHRSRWERLTRDCARPSVAFDGTDRRCVGNMYGACELHLVQALDDDPTRVWLWADGRPVDRGDREGLDGELVLHSLGGAR